MSFTYRMPAEWERHEATWLAWPKNKRTWPGKLLGQVEEIYLRMIAALLTGEKVYLLVDGKETVRYVLSRLAVQKIDTRKLIFFGVKTNDAWIRDYGPIFVKAEGGRRKAEGKIAFTKWVFNAWGGKYGDLARDNRVADRTPYLKSYRRLDPGIILEGGSIDVNGRGTLLTTEQCLLNSNRNKHLSRRQIEAYLKKYLGVEKIIWLKRGIEGDDTDGHIDDVARFVDPATVLVALESDVKDKNYAALMENRAILTHARNERGKKIKVIGLPMPGRIGRLPASYANFYIGNRAVLVPVYSHRHDKTALKIIREFFPGRKVTGIECTPLVHGLGSIHCVTQQQPA